MTIPLSWRLTIAAAVLLTAIGGFAYVRHLQTEAGRLREDLATSQAQVANNAEAVRQVDRFTHTQTIIRERADHEVEAVQSAPGASSPIPGDVRDAWVSGLGRMRDGGADGEDHGS